MNYHEFCATDPFFYDKPDCNEPAEHSFSSLLPVPPEWSVDDGDVWRMLWPGEVALPPQGWKVHVSATLGNADRVLAAVHGYCLPRRIVFKHLRSRRQLLMSNSKYAARASSGKFITIYPADEDALRTVLADLSAALAGEVGPYILSDLRYGAGPLYARYGGFAKRWVESGATRELAIEGPDGVLVPDRREPRFQVPDWVSVPEFLTAHLAARGAGDAGQFPYRITEALHYSNGGGVYRASRLADGQQVVLKEARPHAGLDSDGRDAVRRLHHEYDVLRRLADVPGVVDVHELDTCWEHHFLAMRSVAGVPLKRWLAQHYPQSQTSAAERDLATYTARALAIIDRVDHVVAEVHRRGVVIGDLHPGNIMIDDRDQVTLIDFEVAFDAWSGSVGQLGAPGFRAPAGRTSTAVDDYALAVLRLWLFMPLAQVLELAPDKVYLWVGFVERRFGLPASFAQRVLAELAPTPGPVPAPAWPSDAAAAGGTDWARLRASIVEGMLASATPARSDRLFPGDPYLFEVGATGFAHGASGVLYTLDTVGAGRYPECEQWLLDAVRRVPPAWPGFYHGSHGVAAVLDGFGYHDQASQLVDQTQAQVDRTIDPSLESGLAGIGIGLLGLTEPRHRAAALVVADRLAALLLSADQDGEQPTGGLGRGWSGAALLFVRVFEHTGEPSWLELADRAVQRDLSGCVPAAGDGLQVLDRWGRALSYVDTGVAGIALAAAALAAHAPAAPSAAVLPRLLRGCHGEFITQPGLAQGRAGLLLALATAVPRHTDQPTEDAISQHLSHLAWHAVGYRGATAFPGHQLLRLSMDLATGSAGVLLALHAVLGQPGECPGPVLPFLGNRRRVTTSAL